MRRPTFKHECTYTANSHSNEVADEKFFPNAGGWNLFDIIQTKWGKKNYTRKDVGKYLVG